MTLFKIIAFLTILVVYCNSQGNGKGNNDNRRERRQSRLTRAKRKRIDDDNNIGSNFDDNPSLDYQPEQPQDKFNDIKTNGILIEQSENGEQYETYFQDSDIYEILAEELENGNESSDEDTLNSNEENDDLIRRLSVQGEDERWEIRSTNIRTLPQQFVGMFYFTDSSNTGHWCTATVVDYDWVLTAGHCVHEGNGGSWYGNKRFYPRRNGLYTSSAIYTKTCHSFIGWTQNGDWNWDFALCQLHSSAGVGYSSFGYDNLLNSQDTLFVIGYPGDKTFGTMWSSFDNLHLSTNDYILYATNIDTYGGMSGGPWYRYNVGKQVIYGVHSHSALTYNAATRINKYKFDWICDKTGRC